MLRRLKALWDLNALANRARRGDLVALDALCRRCLEPDRTAREHVQLMPAPLQREALRLCPELASLFLRQGEWQWALERQFLLEAWPDSLSAPPLRSSNPAEVAAYRLLTGQDADPEWVLKHYPNASPAGRSRLLARLRQLGLGHLLGQGWDELPPEQALARAPCGWGAELLGRIPPGDPGLDSLRSLVPEGKLRLDYPRPVRQASRRLQHPIGWLAFVGDLLALWDESGQLWLWDALEEPRRLAPDRPSVRPVALATAIFALHSDRQARLWTPQLAWEQPVSRGLERVSASSDGRFLLVSGPAGFELFDLGGQRLLSGKGPAHGFGASGELVTEGRTYRLPGLEPLDSPVQLARSGDPRVLARSPRKALLVLPGRNLTVGGAAGNMALDETARRLAVVRWRMRVDLYHLAGDGRDLAARVDWYPHPATPHERFAHLLWRYQRRYEVEVEDPRPQLEHDIELQD